MSSQINWTPSLLSFIRYLYTPDGFSFLELNPRLQVEHPCSEMVTDVNIPAAQLQVAMGFAIPFGIPEAEPSLTDMN